MENGFKLVLTLYLTAVRPSALEFFPQMALEPLEFTSLAWPVKPRLFSHHEVRHETLATAKVTLSFIGFIL